MPYYMYSVFVFKETNNNNLKIKKWDILSDPETLGVENCCVNCKGTLFSFDAISADEGSIKRIFERDSIETQPELLFDRFINENGKELFKYKRHPNSANFVKRFYIPREFIEINNCIYLLQKMEPCPDVWIWHNPSKNNCNCH